MPKARHLTLAMAVKAKDSYGSSAACDNLVPVKRWVCDRRDSVLRAEAQPLPVPRVWSVQTTPTHLQTCAPRGLLGPSSHPQDSCPGTLRAGRCWGLCAERPEAAGAPPHYCTSSCRHQHTHIQQ